MRQTGIIEPRRWLGPQIASTEVEAEEHLRRRMGGAYCRRVRASRCVHGVSICTFSVGGTLPQSAACVTFSGVFRFATAAPLDKVT